VEARKACRIYVGLLHLAAMHDGEAALADYLATVLDGGGTPDLEAARAVVAPAALAAIPAVMVPAHPTWPVTTRCCARRWSPCVPWILSYFRDTTLDPLLAAGADRT
jgi:hypothetical protein